MSVLPLEPEILNVQFAGPRGSSASTDRYRSELHDLVFGDDMHELIDDPLVGPLDDQTLQDIALGVVF